VTEAGFPVEPARRRRPRLGYAMAAVAAVLWGVNGAVSKTILASGLSSERLAQLRSLGAAAGLVAILAVVAPARLRLTRRELPYLLAFGVGGLAFVRALRAARRARRRRARPRVAARVGFLFASVFWAVVVPWWSFPGHRLAVDADLGGNLAGHHLPVWLLAAWMVLLGTIVPFFLLVSALRHVSATTAGIVAMLEPVVGALVGWLWLSETLDGVQLGGAAVVLAAIGLAQTAR
jgi:drug/metabolite transporter (DMT)-like permease